VERILVIRLGALGDFVLSAGPFAAIRRHHPDAHIVLLTAEPYADLARAAPWFDEVWIDKRPEWWDVPGWWALRQRLRGGGFARVYDLQTSDRSSFYFRLMGPGRPEWSGVARGASHPDDNPERRRIHTVERQAEQLRRAGIEEVPPPDLSWVEADTARFGVPEPYVLLVPGGAPHRPDKRWPARAYRALAKELIDRGYTPVVLGTGSESEAAATIQRTVPKVRSLVGRTDFTDVVGLARGAAAAVGNDTGPMHLIAAVGCPSVVLFSGASNPLRTAPRPPASAPPVLVLRRRTLSQLPVPEVVAALETRLTSR